VSKCWSGCSHKPVKVDNATVKDAPVTYVLYRCPRCGDTYSEELDGTWTLADINGASGA
jgi:hypothetical protein